jgi:hypothetical protein
MFVMLLTFRSTANATTIAATLPNGSILGTTTGRVVLQ